MNSGRNKICALVFVSLLCWPLASNLVGVPKSFSELENRMLSTGIKLDKNLFSSGVLAERTETFVQDQFPMRDALVNLKSDFQVLLGNNENNGVYLGKDGYLFRKFEDYIEKTFLDNLDAVKSIMRKLGDKLRVLAVPSASLVLEEKLPDHVSADREKETLGFFNTYLKKNGGSVDLLEPIASHKDESVYFKTDHHWTQYGAYLGYTEIMHSYGLEPVDLNKFIVDNRENFQGTHYSKFRGKFVKGERFTFYQNPKENVEVYYVAEDRTEKSLFFTQNLDTRDKYKVYLDGNYPLMTIRNHEIMNGEKILVLKDSYANAVVPFLVDSFQEVHLMDLRYYNLSLQDYIEKGGFDKVILLYGMDSYLNDESLRKLVN
ncbi:MAG: DHHW family protein [Clostridiaceae bacterium]